MQRGEAERVLAMVADVRGDLRERIVLQRWWLVWILVGVQIASVNIVTQVLLWRGVEGLAWHGGVWTGQIVLLALTIKVVQRRGGGQRTDREGLLWTIWLAFLGFSCLLAALAATSGGDLFGAVVPIAVMASMSWAITAVAVHPAFWLGSALMSVAAIAMALLPEWRFMIYGGSWLLIFETLGLTFYRLATDRGRGA